jgi:predicted small integral membrane protein
MATDAALDRLRSDLDRAIEKTRADLDRIEILVAGLAAFNAPIPGYEPRFQHLRRHTTKVQELTAD